MTLIRSTLLLAVALLALSPAAHAATTVTGGNLTTQTWTAANSPYVVQGDVTIPSGQTLTIESGVTVQLASTDSQGGGTDTGRVEIIVNGSLVATGTSASPVAFQAQTSGQTWVGIRIGSTGSATLTGFDIKDATNGIATAAAAGWSVTALKGRISGSSGCGLSINGDAATASGTATINTVELDANANGVCTSGVATLNLVNSLVHNNTASGVTMNLSGGIVNSVIDSNSGPGVVLNSGLLKNSIVTNNITGISGSASASQLTFNDVYGNSTGNYAGSATDGGSGSKSVDPKFANAAAGNYHLMSTSTLINAGTSGSDVPSSDFDGDARPYASTAPDIGADETPYTGTSSGGGVIYSNSGDYGGALNLLALLALALPALRRVRRRA